MFIINIREILPYTLIKTSDICLLTNNTTGLLKEFVGNHLLDTSKNIIETDYGFGVYFKKKDAAKYLNQRASKRDYYNIFQCEVCKKWYFNDARNMKKKILTFDQNKAWFPITCSRQCQNYVHNVIHNVGTKRLRQYYEEHPENQGKWARQWRENNPEAFKEACALGGKIGYYSKGGLKDWKESPIGKESEASRCISNRILQERMCDPNDELYNLDFAKRFRSNGVLYEYNDNGIIVSINEIAIDEYIKNIKKLPINFIPNDFFLQNTFRDQKSINTNALLDNDLKKKNICWFVYIKYDENGIPLVVGKSGSLLVNAYGCDVCFDKNRNGGPARQYLIKNNLDWNKTQIAISPCLTEEEALKKEKEVCLKYGLFYS